MKPLDGNILKQSLEIILWPCIAGQKSGKMGHWTPGKNCRGHRKNVKFLGRIGGQTKP